MARERAPVLAHQRFLDRQHELEGLSQQALFTKIWQTNLWGAETSRSGLGSENAATAVLRSELPALLKRLSVRTLLDLPCGDFGWLSRTELGLDRYLGADIVDEIIVRNRGQFATPDRRIAFATLDLLTDNLPAMDAILCRDCLVHLSFSNVARALSNIARSGSQWFIATTFPDHDINIDIADGDWRLLNLQKAPFNFPAPFEVLNEGCNEARGTYDDKSLGVWRIASLTI